MNRRHRNRGRPGFTLVEALIGTAVVGLGIAATLTAVNSGTRVHEVGRDATEAAFLAQEIREWTLKLPFTDPDPADAANPPGPDGSDPTSFVDDLDDMLNVTYSPPRNGQGLSIYAMDGWSQVITLTWRDPANLSGTVAAGSSDIVHVDVDVRKNGVSILNTGWLVVRR